MKIKLFLVSCNVFLRITSVIVSCMLGGYYVIGPVLRRLVDALYRFSGERSWQALFYLLSNNYIVFLCLGCIAVLLLASGWVFRPVFTAYATICADLLHNNIHLKKDGPDDEQIELPKQLQSLEDVLNNVNAEIRLSRYAAKEAEQRKDDLVVYLAHDIRTPLTSVLGYLELLIENQDLPEAQRGRFMDAALRKAGRMQSLVEELFEVTRYSITQLELEKSPVNLSMMLTQLVEELRPVLEQREIEVETTLSEVPVAFADPDKIARSLDNILHNAAYYTPPGGKITVTLSGGADTSACIKVSNTGTEIPPEKLARLFEKFYRGEEARRSATGGSGLGLAIAKNIIEAHGGSITAESADGITTFTILT